MQSRLARQLAEAAAALHDIEAPFALIGGLALAAHGVVRATHDVDFLVEAGCADAIVPGNASEAGQSIAGLRVVSAEGLIGFKLQALVNDPRRTQDLEDIRALLRANPGSLDLAEVRGYFRLFDRESQLDELLGEIR